MGCNAVRLSHNVYPKYVLEWCDRNGMLVYDEMYDKWSGGSFTAKARISSGIGSATWPFGSGATATIRRCSFGVSATRFSRPAIEGPQFRHRAGEIDSTRGVRLWTQMYDHVRYYDRTRPVTTALFPDALQRHPCRG